MDKTGKIRVGDTLPLPLDGSRERRPARVIYIHPAGRFVVMEFTLLVVRGLLWPGERYERRIRQTYPLRPKPDRLCSSMGEPWRQCGKHLGHREAGNNDGH